MPHRLSAPRARPRVGLSLALVLALPACVALPGPETTGALVPAAMPVACRVVAAPDVKAFSPHFAQRLLAAAYPSCREIRDDGPLIVELALAVRPAGVSVVPGPDQARTGAPRRRGIVYVLQLTVRGRDGTRYGEAAAQRTLRRSVDGEAQLRLFEELARLLAARAHAQT